MKKPSTFNLLHLHSAFSLSPSQVILEVPLRPYPSPDAENVRRHDVRAQLHEVARAVPRVARVAEEVVDLERAAGVEAEGGEVQLDVARLRVVRIDADDAQHDVLPHRFAVAEELVVRRLVEAERRVLLQGRILAADAVDDGDEVREVV